MKSDPNFYAPEFINQMREQGHKIDLTQVTVQGDQLVIYSDADDSLIAELVAVNIANADLRQQEQLKLRTVKLADEKHAAIIAHIVGWRYSDKQMERYEIKYQQALAGHFDDATNQAIITKHDQIQSQINAYSEMIEFARCTIADLIESMQIEKARMALDWMEGVDSSMTPRDLKNLLEKL